MSDFLLPDMTFNHGDFNDKKSKPVLAVSWCFLGAYCVGYIHKEDEWYKLIRRLIKHDKH
jgi:hypothetical protein